MEKKRLSIARNGGSKQTPTPEEIKSGISTGILLPSAQDTETDPFKAELAQKGYTIISENEFGVAVRKLLGKPTFMFRTQYGYFEVDSPNNFRLPKSIQTTMKMHIASLGINAQQYIVQLVVKDLREKGLL